MFNVNKYVKISTALFAVALTACGSGDKSEQIDAGKLLSEAKECLSEGMPGKGLALLDSLDSKYKSQVDLLRESMELRPRLIALECEQQLAVLDSLIMSTNTTLDSVASFMQHINVPSTPGYWIDKRQYDPSFPSATGLSARVDEIGEFYLVSAVVPSAGLKHTQVNVSSGGLTATTGALSESDVLTSGNAEYITIFPQKAADVKSVIMSLPDEAMLEISFVGHKKTKTLKMKNSGLKTAALYSDLIGKQRINMLERERLEKKLAAAQDMSDRKKVK